MRAILTYHSIDPSGSVISIDPERFQSHVQWLASGAVRVATIEELLSLPPEVDAVALTFDDGFDNFRTLVWPLLREHGLPATVFVVTEGVGKMSDSLSGEDMQPSLKLLDWDALGLLAEEGVAVGSHGWSHARLDRVGPAALEMEIAHSAARIEREIGARPDFFCYPFGRSSRGCLELVRAHYSGAVTTDLRVLSVDESPFMLPRLDTYYFRKPGTLEAWGSPRFHRRLWIRSRARRVRRGRPRDRVAATGAVREPGRASAGSASVPSTRTAGATVTVVIPVLNEAHVLAASVGKVREFLSHHPEWTWRVAIVDNGSTDGTDAAAQELSARYPDVDAFRLGKRGRGGALRFAWVHSTADIVCYTDVDLSTDLEALPRLLSAIRYEGYDVATGSRLMKGSRTVRSRKREIISRGYNLLVKALLLTSFSDAQCGFKAVSRRAVEDLVPQIVDDSWFFDTELLVLAERRGYKIKDVTITWVEDNDSRVKILRTGWEDVKGLFRLRMLFWKEAWSRRSRRADPAPS